MSLYEFFTNKIDDFSRACSRGVDYAKEHPIKSAGIIAATVVAGGARILSSAAIMKGVSGVIDYGKTRKDGGHDHRTNTGKDRTPAQRSGDAKRRQDA